ncbi:VWA domain-containing protein [bacterium]|nr:VWA domain-containing protein [bacterium]
MILSNPFGLALLALIPLVIIIHNLKPNAKQVSTTTLFLWSEALHDQGSGFHLRRLRKNLPLILQILIIILAALAFSNPTWLFESKPAGNIILVMDTSASMQTRVSNQTRFDLARDAAIELVENLEAPNRIMIIEAGIKPSILQAFSADKTRLKQVMADQRPYDIAADLKSSVFFALSFVRPESSDKVVVITDRPGNDLLISQAMSDLFEKIVIEGGQRNTGITKFAFRQQSGTSDSFQILVAVKNFNEIPTVCPVEITLDEIPIDNRTIGLLPGEEKQYFLDFEGMQAGKALVRLKIEDDLQLDNQAYAIINPKSTIHVYLLTKGNPFLEQVLSIFPNVIVNKSPEVIPGSWEQIVAQNHLVIVDGIDSPAIDYGNLLYLNIIPSNAPLLVAGKISNPEIVDWKRNHPLLRNLDLSGIRIEQALKVSANEDLQPIIQSGQTGLGFVHEKGALRAVFLAFDLKQSNFPLKVAFPVFFGNLLHWMTPGKLELDIVQAKTGEPVPLYLDSGGGEITIRRPDRTIVNVQAETVPFIYRNTVDAGFYKVKEERRWFYFAANLLDANESDIRGGREVLTSNNLGIMEEPIVNLAHFGLWSFLFLLATLFLFLEWFFWLEELWLP